jgi:hypothetical protein
MLREHKLQQGTGRNNVKIWLLFMEISQHFEKFSRGLNLVQEQQRAARINRRVELKLQESTDLVGRLRNKQRCHLRLLLEVEVNGVLEVSIAEILDEVRLAHLPGAAHHQGLSGRGVFPANKLSDTFPLHPDHSLKRPGRELLVFITGYYSLTVDIING